MGEEPQGFLDNIFQDGMFSRIDNESECYDDLFTHYIPFEEMEMREYFTGHNESERRSYFHRGLSLRSIGSVGVNTIITTGSTGFDGMDSYDTRDGDLTPSLRSRSDSGGSVDMFYDYSNSSDGTAWNDCDTRHYLGLHTLFLPKNPSLAHSFVLQMTLNNIFSFWFSLFLT